MRNLHATPRNIAEIDTVVSELIGISWVTEDLGHPEWTSTAPSWSLAVQPPHPTHKDPQSVELGAGQGEPGGARWSPSIRSRGAVDEAFRPGPRLVGVRVPTPRGDDSNLFNCIRRSHRRQPRRNQIENVWTNRLLSAAMQNRFGL